MRGRSRARGRARGLSQAVVARPGFAAPRRRRSSPATRSGSALRRCSRRPSCSLSRLARRAPALERRRAARRPLLADWRRGAGISVAWSVAPDRSWDELNRGLVYAAFAVLGRRCSARLGPRALAAGRARCSPARSAPRSLWALAGKAIPALFPDGGRAARLRDPIGYWNALALVANALLVLGLWLAARRVARARAPARRDRAGLRRGRGDPPRRVACRRRSARSSASRSGSALGRSRVERALLALAAAVPAVAVAGWAFTRPGARRGRPGARRPRRRRRLVRRARSWPGPRVAAPAAALARASRSLTPSERRAPAGRSRSERSRPWPRRRRGRARGRLARRVAGASAQSPGRPRRREPEQPLDVVGRGVAALRGPTPLRAAAPAASRSHARRLREDCRRRGRAAQRAAPVPRRDRASAACCSSRRWSPRRGVAAVGALRRLDGEERRGGRGAHRRPARLSPARARRLQLGLRSP